jgi:hypothetical protein
MNNKEAWEMDSIQRIFCKNKRENRNECVEREMNIRKMNSNLSKVCLVLRWIYHLSKVISPVEKSTNLQLCKFKNL